MKSCNFPAGFFLAEEYALFQIRDQWMRYIDAVFAILGKLRINDFPFLL